MKAFLYFIKTENNSRAAMLLAVNQRAATELAIATVREQIGPEASVSYVAPICHIDLGRFCRQELIRQLCLTDKVLMTQTLMSEQAEKMLETLENSQRLVSAAKEEILRAEQWFANQQSEDERASDADSPDTTD